MGTEGRHDQRRSAPKVCCPDLRPLEAVHAAHHSDPAFHPDIRPHADEFVHMAVAVFKNILHKHGRSPAPQQGCHQHSLGICGKARIGSCAHRTDRMQIPAAPEEHRIPGAMYLAARLVEGAGNRGQVAVVHLPQFHLTPCCGHRRKVGRRNNAVGHDGMLAVMSGAAALDSNRGSPRPLDSTPHTGEEALKIQDLRFPGGIH